MRDRAARQHIEVKFGADLNDGVPHAWSGRIEQLLFRGSRFMDEVVLFHRQSSTLILADLTENFEPHRVSGKFRWLL